MSPHQPGHSLLGKSGQPFGVTQAGSFAAQLFLFIAAQRGGFDFLELKTEQIGTAFGFGLGFMQMAKLPAGCLQALPGGVILVQRGAVTGEAVEQREMAAHVEQRKMFGLPVDIHQQLSQAAHQTERGAAR